MAVDTVTLVAVGVSRGISTGPDVYFDATIWDESSCEDWTTGAISSSVAGVLVVVVD